MYCIHDKQFSNHRRVLDLLSIVFICFYFVSFLWCDLSPSSLFAFDIAQAPGAHLAQHRISVSGALFFLLIFKSDSCFDDILFLLISTSLLHGRRLISISSSGVFYAYIPNIFQIQSYRSSPESWN